VKKQVVDFVHSYLITRDSWSDSFSQIIKLSPRVIEFVENVPACLTPVNQISKAFYGYGIHNLSSSPEPIVQWGTDVRVWLTEYLNAMGYSISPYDGGSKETDVCTYRINKRANADILNTNPIETDRITELALKLKTHAEKRRIDMVALEKERKAKEVADKLAHDRSNEECRIETLEIISNYMMNNDAGLYRISSLQNGFEIGEYSKGYVSNLVKYTAKKYTHGAGSSWETVLFKWIDGFCKLTGVFSLSRDIGTINIYRQ